MYNLIYKRQREESESMKHILVVDDNRLNLTTAKDALKELYSVSTAASGIEALKFLKNKPVDLILLDIEMPEMNGIETLMQIKLDDMVGNIPVIFLTGINDNEVEAKCLTLGAQDFIVKPFYRPAMLSRIQRVLELDELRKNLEGQVIQKTKEVESLTLQTVITFANAIDAKDPYTKGHSLRVAEYSQAIAKRLGWGELEIKNIYYTALLHDIGKIGIPDSILTKPGKLTEEEFSMIKKHPGIGVRILESVIVVPYLGVGAYSHHERYDGKGYPEGLKGEDIPLVGRIVGIADAADAMTSSRAYRKSLSLEKVLDELEKGRGTQFDPVLVDIMIDILKNDNIRKHTNEDLEEQHNNLFMDAINDYVNVSKIDKLTGLWKMPYIEERINQELQYKERKSALLVLDLDNFTRVNEIWGSMAGDSLLVNIAEAISMVTGEFDYGCRSESDEFILFLTNIKNRMEVEEKVEKLLRSIKNKINLVNAPVKVTASIGIAMGGQDGKSFKELYRNADKSLYYVKQRGKNNYYFYSTNYDENEPAPPNPRQVSLKQLKNMLREKEVTPGAYQVNAIEFQKIYQFIQRMIKRSNEPMQVILFTFTDLEGNIPNAVELQEVMEKITLAVKNSLRIGDVATKYSSSQYVVLLKGTESDSTKIVVNRILQKYKMLGENPNVLLQYDVEEIEE